MTPEKFIKKEARLKLSQNNNWIKLITAFMVLVIAVFLFPINVSSIAELIPSFGINDLKNNVNIVSVETLIYFLINMLAVALAILITPLITGYKRYQILVAQGYTVETTELFYYFKNFKRYQETVNFNLSMFLRCFGIGILCLLPFIITDVSSNVTFGLTIFYVPLKLITILLFLAGLMLYYVLTRRYYLASYIFIIKDKSPKYSNLSSNQCIKISVKYMKQEGNINKALKLFMAFIPWILLCFFVIPTLYVVPYYFQAQAESQKYIVNILEERCGVFGSFPMRNSI